MIKDRLVDLQQRKMYIQLHVIKMCHGTKI